METVTPSVSSEKPAALKTISRLAIILVVSTYALMVLGATVRVMDAGLSCPDWPLCHGQVFPPFDPVLTEVGPVPTPAQMNAEWFHRLLAALVSGGLLVLAVPVWRSRDKRLRKTMALSGGLLAIQVLMGAATVLLGNIHYSVAIHLALATAFLLSLSSIARATHADPWFRAFPRAHADRGLKIQSHIALATVGTAILLGAGIATTPGADLVCPSFPHCGRGDYSGVAGLVTLQMTHRVLALGFFFWSIYFAVRASRQGEGKAGAWMVLGLTTLQVLLGILNVLLEVPPAISAAHLGVAVLIFFTLFNWAVIVKADGSNLEAKAS